MELSMALNALAALLSFGFINAIVFGVISGTAKVRAQFGFDTSSQRFSIKTSDRRGIALVKESGC